MFEDRVIQILKVKGLGIIDVLTGASEKEKEELRKAMEDTHKALEEKTRTIEDLKGRLKTSQMVCILLTIVAVVLLIVMVIRR